MTFAPPSLNNNDLVRQRMIADLIAGERSLKEAAQAVNADFRRVLFGLAQKLAGTQVQELLRKDPAAFQAYSPAQWQAFFEQVLAATGWSNQEAHTAHLSALEKEVEQLRQGLERERRRTAETTVQRPAPEPALTSAPERVKKPVKPAPKPTARHETPKPQPVVIFQPAEPVAQEQPAADKPMEWVADGLHKEIIDRLKNWQTPKVPARFTRRVSEDETRWRRQSMALYVMASHGISARMELDHLIGRVESLKNRPTSLREAIDYLSEKGLAVNESYHLHHRDFESALAYVRLSNDGKDLCRLLGWEAVESDWERLLRLHEGERLKEHTFAVLAFAMHARLRGWQAGVMPEVEGAAAPDVFVEKGDRRYYVEVETGDGEKGGKWRNQKDLQGYAALCALLPDERAQLVSDCKNMKMPGVATDLFTLVKLRLPAIGPETPLWLEQWG